MKLHKPVFLIIAGPNGAGKTTLCESPRFLRRMGEWFDTGHFLNPDKVALSERALDPRLSVPEADLLAAEKVEQAAERYLLAKTRVLVEIVLSSDKYKRFWTMAGECGFERHLICIGLDSPEISIQRVRNGRSRCFGRPAGKPFRTFTGQSGVVRKRGRPTRASERWARLSPQRFRDQDADGRPRQKAAMARHSVSRV